MRKWRCPICFCMISTIMNTVPKCPRKIQKVGDNRKQKVANSLRISDLSIWGLRRERDSNPRYLSVRRFSRPLQSTTLPSLLECSGCKGTHNFFNCKLFGTFFYFWTLYRDFGHSKRSVSRSFHIQHCLQPFHRLCYILFEPSVVSQKVRPAAGNVFI